MFEFLHDVVAGIFIVVAGIASQTLAIFGLAPTLEPAVPAPLPAEMRSSIEDHIPPQKEEPPSSPQNTPKQQTGTPEKRITPSQEGITEEAKRAVTKLEQAFVPTPKEQSEANVQGRAALVNILCTNEAGSTVRPITGSGIFIDKQGVILTNAHIAQFFLLEEEHGEPLVDCVIRTGTPAKRAYEAQLLYIPPAWVALHAQNISLESPRGTGENDFAFLLVGRSLTSEDLPQEFPFIPLAPEQYTPEREASAIVAAYPAGFLGGNFIQNSLWPASSVVHIKEYFTFGKNTVDVISLGGSIVAQQGSSGGGVVSIERRELLGTVVTVTEGETTGERNLHAITSGHIHRATQAELGVTLEALLAGDLEQTAMSFRENVGPALRALLLQEPE